MEHRITRSAGVVGAATLLSRILGMVRDILTASFFGTGLALSAFVVAFTIPNLFRKLLGEGPLTGAFVPVFTEYLEKKGIKEGWRVASIICSLLMIILAGAVLAGWAMISLALNTLSLSDKFLLVLRLLRIMLPHLFFICLVGISMGILNSLRHFAVPALAPVVLNLVWIASLFFLCPRFGNTPEKKIFGLAVGIVIGGIIELGIQMLVLKRKGFPFEFIPDWRDPAVKKIALLMGPGILGLAVFQINTAVDQFLAMVIGAGAPAALFYGNRLVQFPLGVFGLAFATAALPEMSRLMARDRIEEFKAVFSHALRNVLLIMVPATVGLIVLRRPVIQLLFQRKAFGADSTEATAWVLLFYSLGLPAFAGLKIVTQGFYSCQDTRTPVKVGFSAMLLNLALNLAVVFTPWLRVNLREGGLALSTSLAAFVNAGVLYYLFRKRLGRIRGKEMLSFLIRLCCASLLMGAACSLSLSFLEGRLSGARLGERAVLVGVPMAAALIAFSIGLIVFQIDEARDLLRALKRKR
ncbi:MAG: murein biosynthesis integral membrane protein MurJ [PVC group bacterium]